MPNWHSAPSKASIHHQLKHLACICCLYDCLNCLNVPPSHPQDALSPVWENYDQLRKKPSGGQPVAVRLFPLQFPIRNLVTSCDFHSSINLRIDKKAIGARVTLGTLTLSSRLCSSPFFSFPAYWYQHSSLCRHLPAGPSPSTPFSSASSPRFRVALRNYISRSFFFVPPIRSSATTR